MKYNNPLNLNSKITGNPFNKMNLFLEKNGIADSFKNVKRFDTIELEGTDKNGKERRLILDILNEYGKDAVFNSDSFKYLMPCISEGVIKSRTIENVIYYTHFKVVNETEYDFGLNIKEYKFFEDDFFGNSFHLRYIINLTNIPKISNEILEFEYNVNSACAKQFFLDSFSSDELEKEFTKSEMEMLIDYTNSENNNLNETVKAIINFSFTTLQSVNFLLEYQKREYKKNINGATVINDDKNYTAVNKEHIIPINKFYKWKKGTEANVVLNTPSHKIIMRKTEKWLVKGHLRHYKSGKVVQVEPYYKGPKRNSDNKIKTTFKINEYSVDDFPKKE